MSILVTGGDGFIGSSLIKELGEVINVDIKSGIDIRNKDELEKVFSENKIDTIYHLAAIPGVRYSLENPSIYIETNITGTANVLELAKKYNVKKIIFASSSSVYGNLSTPFIESAKLSQISVYAATKRAGEVLMETYHNIYGIDITILRFFTVYGPNGRKDMAIYGFTDKIMKGKEIEVFNEGNLSRDFTYIDDVVSALVSCLDKKLGFEIINIGTGVKTNVLELIRIIEKVTGKKADKIMESMQKGDVLITQADISKAKNLLNYNPKINLEEGIKKFFDWYKNYF